MKKFFLSLTVARTASGSVSASTAFSSGQLWADDSELETFDVYRKTPTQARDAGFTHAQNLDIHPGSQNTNHFQTNVNPASVGMSGFDVAEHPGARLRYRDRVTNNVRGALTHGQPAFLELEDGLKEKNQINSDLGGGSLARTVYEDNHQRYFKAPPPPAVPTHKLAFTGKGTDAYSLRSDNGEKVERAHTGSRDKPLLDMMVASQPSLLPLPSKRIEVTCFP